MSRLLRMILKSQYITLLNILKGTQYVLITQVGRFNSITGLL